MTLKNRFALIVCLMAGILSACASPTVRPMDKVRTTPDLQDGDFIALDGARLPLRHWLPKGSPPRAILIALHGFNDYSNFFKDTGPFLASSGIATYAYDQRGFGKTANAGYWTGDKTMTQDLETLVGLMRGSHPGIPLFVFGESMGGAVAMVTAATARKRGTPLDIDGIILSAPAVWGRETMPWYQTSVLWLGAHVFPGALMTGRGLKIVPSDNIDMLIELGRDPLVIKKTRVDAIYGLTNLMDAALEAAFDLQEPMLILYGKKDEIIQKEPTELMLSRLPSAGKDERDIIFYENGYHMLTRDLQGPTVWNDIRRWIAGRSGFEVDQGEDR